jgi:hypothetical protein
LYSDQDDRSLPQSIPVAMIGATAPVERTASTSVCMPAVRQPSSSLQPSRQHFHVMSCGSL